MSIADLQKNQRGLDETYVKIRCPILKSVKVGPDTCSPAWNGRSLVTLRAFQELWIPMVLIVTSYASRLFLGERLLIYATLLRYALLEVCQGCFGGLDK
jgi:hypothetical protein